MGLFSKNMGPVFLKSDNLAEDYIEKLKVIQGKCCGELKEEIEKQITIAEYGIKGEESIAFELKNSGMYMYILKDICVESGDLSAQIDYLIVTRKRIYILECKNLIGDIEINNSGDFIRTYQLNGRKIREGIYSPITQNKRHLQIIKEVRKTGKTNIITQRIFEKNFNDNYKSIIVLANPKTILNAKYAKKEIKEQIVRADQLVQRIKKMDESVKEAMTNKEMLEVAQFFLDRNKADRLDYAAKYEALLERFNTVKQTEQVVEKSAVKRVVAEEFEAREPISKEFSRIEAVTKELSAGEPVAENISIEEVAATSDGLKEKLKAELKAFRLERSRKEEIKPYYIYNDAQLEDLMEKNPKSKEELCRVAGFGSVKAEKYGEEILEILRKG